MSHIVIKVSIAHLCTRALMHKGLLSNGFSLSWIHLTLKITSMSYLYSACEQTTRLASHQVTWSWHNNVLKHKARSWRLRGKKIYLAVSNMQKCSFNSSCRDSRTRLFGKLYALLWPNAQWVLGDLLHYESCDLSLKDKSCHNALHESRLMLSGSL